MNEIYEENENLKSMKNNLIEQTMQRNSLNNDLQKKLMNRYQAQNNPNVGTKVKITPFFHNIFIVICGKGFQWWE
jgi:hypothetical protein